MCKLLKKHLKIEKMELSRNQRINLRCFIMLDFEISKKLNIKAEKIDLDKSYYSFNPNTCYLTIELYLKKDVDIICPICGSREILVRGSKLSVIKTSFIDSNNVIVNVHRRIYKCRNNHSFIQDNPLSPEGRKISIQKDILILNALKDKTKTYSSIAKEFDVSTTYVIELFDRRIEARRLSLPTVLCIDEVHAKKLVKNSYCCVLYAPQWKKIVDVLDSRHKLNLIDYFSKVSIEEKNKVQFVSMDLWDSYRDVAKLCFPKAKICADPFHVVKNLVMCFQYIRIAIMKKYEHLKHEGSNYYWLFKKFWKFLIMDISKITNEPIKVTKSGMLMSKYQIIDCMLTLDHKLHKAYDLKEEYRNFVATSNIDIANDELNILISKFKEAHIPEYTKFIKLLDKWHDEIVNSFNMINGHKITNGSMERVNRDIKTIFGISFGSTNFIRMRNRIIYCINQDVPILAWRKKQTNKKVGKPRGKYKRK